MAARLQATNSAGRPVLLRTSADMCHGIGTGMSEQIELDADVYASLMGQLGTR